MSVYEHYGKCEAECNITYRYFLFLDFLYISVFIISIGKLSVFEVWSFVLGPDYMANFSPGWNFYPANRAEILLRLHDELQPRAEILVSAPNMKLREKSLGRIRHPYYFLLFCPGWNFFSITWDFFSPGRNSAGLKILARFGQTMLGFSARADLHPGLKKSPCNRQFDFKRICFRSRAEISARAEILHVIRPFKNWEKCEEDPAFQEDLSPKSS